MREIRPFAVTAAARKSMGCGASTAARVGPEPTEIIEALDSSTETKATLSARLNASLCLAPALRPVLWPRLLDVGSSNTPDFAALLERAGGDAGGGIDTSYLKTIDADVPRTDRDEDAFRDADGAGLRALRRLLLAHCARDGGDGYFQGMNDLAAVVLHAVNATAGTDAAVAAAFGVFEGVLADTRANWAHDDLAGVHAQARLVQLVLQAADPKLAKKLAATTRARAGAKDQPLLFLFQPLFLRFKREMASYEEAPAVGGELVPGRAPPPVAAALVRTQQAARQTAAGPRPSPRRRPSSPAGRHDARGAARRRREGAGRGARGAACSSSGSLLR